MLSLVALVVLLPFLAVESVIICPDDPNDGPFFVQDRVVKNGKLFRFLKFRSMVVDAEARLEELKDLNEMDGPPFMPLTEQEDALVCDRINALNPDFLWVGIGAPKQEMWMQAHRDKVYGCVMLGVGVGFDFLAVTLGKPPSWMEKACLEWFFRLC